MIILHDLNFMLSFHMKIMIYIQIDEYNGVEISQLLGSCNEIRFIQNIHHEQYY